MVADFKVIRVIRRVPAEKVKDQQVADIHGDGQRTLGAMVQLHVLLNPLNSAFPNKQPTLVDVI